MKKQLFFAATLFFFAGILACNQQPANVPSTNVAPNAPASKMTPDAATSMIVTDRKTGELDSTDAKKAIALWNGYRDSLQLWLQKSLPAVAKEIPTGFKIASQDIHSLDSIARGTTELYAMLALQPNRCTGKTELTLIFRAPDKTNTPRYYDFSMPCPPCTICGSK